MKADIGISIKDYHRNKNLKMLLYHTPFPPIPSAHKKEANYLSAPLYAFVHDQRFVTSAEQVAAKFVPPVKPGRVHSFRPAFCAKLLHPQLHGACGCSWDIEKLRQTKPLQ
jgi:hypothetical protein